LILARAMLPWLYWKLVLPLLPPLPLRRRPEPFSHPDWLFEINYDGFRSLAYRDPSGVRLVSRNGNRFASFVDLCAGIEMFLKEKHAVLDGEIACLGDQGHSQFNELLFRRGTPIFCVFDLLYLDGEDVRERPLIERKRMLRRIVPERGSRRGRRRAPLSAGLRARPGGHRGQAAAQPVYHRARQPGMAEDQEPELLPAARSR
jgi:ATP-dependent DNA ligase